MNQQKYSLFLALIFAVLLGGCAAGPFPVDPGQGGGGTTTRYLTFTWKVNSGSTLSHSGRGYYIILLNATGQAINVTVPTTYTDFIRYDGINFTWFHLNGVGPGQPGTFTPAGTVNQFASVAPDDKSFNLRFNVNDTSILLSQYVVANVFTVHVVSTDSYNGAYIGRALDTLGQGPDINNNPSYTMTVNKQSGIVPPIPAGYPNDPLNDWIIQPDLPGPDNPNAFPYSSYDIENFQITSSN